MIYRFTFFLGMSLKVSKAIIVPKLDLISDSTKPSIFLPLVAISARHQLQLFSIAENIISFAPKSHKSCPISCYFLRLFQWNRWRRGERARGEKLLRKNLSCSVIVTESRSRSACILLVGVKFCFLLSFFWSSSFFEWKSRSKSQFYLLRLTFFSSRNYFSSSKRYQSCSESNKTMSSSLPSSFWRR